jgi:hypothetical protein
MAQWLSYIINHVCLPPQLPQKDDSGFEQDVALLIECQAALRSYQTHLSDESWRWVNCTGMVNNMINIGDSSGDMLPQKVKTSLKEMADSGILVSTRELLPS